MDRIHFLCTLKFLLQKLKKRARMTWIKMGKSEKYNVEEEK